MTRPCTPPLPAHARRSTPTRQRSACLLTSRLLTAGLVAAALALALPASTSHAQSLPDRTRPPTPGPIKPFTLPVPKIFTLENGVVVHHLRTTRAPLVHIIVELRGGALHEAPGQEGSVNSLALLMRQGAGGRDTMALDDAALDLGAQLSTSGSWTGITAALHVASARLPQALPLLADVVLRPQLSGDEWARIQGERIAALRAARADPGALVSLAAARALFGDARPGTNLGGTPASIGGLGMEDLRALHARLLHPQAMSVLIVGDLDEGAARRLLAASFGALRPPVGDKAPTAPGAQAPTLAHSGVRTVLVAKDGAPQTALQVVGALPDDLPALHAPTATMATLLGGSFTSRLNHNLREVHGYTYGARYGVSTWPLRTQTVSTSVATPVTAPALHEIAHELSRIQLPAETDEVARARAYRAHGFPALFDGTSQTAQAWRGFLDEGLGAERLQAWPRAVLATTPDDVAEAARRLLAERPLVVVAVGDPAVVAPALQSIGPLTTWSADDLLPLPAAGAADAASASGATGGAAGR